MKMILLFLQHSLSALFIVSVIYINKLMLILICVKFSWNWCFWLMDTEFVKQTIYSRLVWHLYIMCECCFTIYVYWNVLNTFFINIFYVVPWELSLKLPLKFSLEDIIHNIQYNNFGAFSEVPWSSFFKWQ